MSSYSAAFQVRSLSPNNGSRTILITGATDGIGLALAQHYQQLQWRVLLVGRRPLASLCAPLFTEQCYCEVDLSRSDCAEAMAGWLNDRGITSIDVLVHNAALGYYGAVGAQSHDNIRRLINVNVHAPIAITRALLPLMRGADPQVVFVSSVAAVLPAPLYAIYGATKAALESFAINLRVELGARVRVQIVVPGATHTAMHGKSGVPESVLQGAHLADADVVARAIARAIRSGGVLTTIGWRNRVLRSVGCALPGLVERVMRGRSA